MGFRVLFYIMLIWDAERRRWETGNVPKRQRRLSPILPIVFYTGERRWQTPLSLDAIMNLPEELSRFVPRFDTLFSQCQSDRCSNPDADRASTRLAPKSASTRRGGRGSNPSRPH